MKHFSKLEASAAYIPQVKSPEYSYPLVACCTEDIDPELYEWTDPDRNYEYYNLTKDCDQVLTEDCLADRKSLTNCFDRIKHWPFDDSSPKAIIDSSSKGCVPFEPMREHSKLRPVINKPSDLYDDNSSNKTVSTEDATDDMRPSQNTQYDKAIVNVGSFIGNIGEHVEDILDLAAPLLS
mmetsp:Transcript_11710/g.14555  ORF Transcript_11710/g.14555 Transcript_11710/m.14555 type:complete len:180 (+) Transcript_11710:35-574(+)